MFEQPTMTMKQARKIYARENTTRTFRQWARGELKKAGVKTLGKLALICG